MTTVLCTECDCNIELTDDLVIGEIIVCPDCGIELEVMSLEPLSVDLAPQVEEDWGE